MKLMENTQVKRIVEAAILAAGQPLSPLQLSALFGESEPIASEAIAQALAELREDYAESGVELVEVASGFRFQVRHDVHAWVSRLWTERQTKYSRALLETLALVAYRQPITRAEIEQIRGVAVSTNMVRTLEEREWIRVVGHRDVPGRPALFGTTRQFLDYFNLRSLDQLPALSEIRDIEELEPELDLAGIPGATEPTGDDAVLDADALAEAAGSAVRRTGAADEDDVPREARADDDESEPLAAGAAMSADDYDANASNDPEHEEHRDATGDASPEDPESRA